MGATRSGVFMLEVIDLSFKYDKSDWLFKHVNITIRPGEIVGMYGKSGSGKTTMLKVIAGYMPPSEGAVIVDGKNVIEIVNKCAVHPVQLIWQHPEKAINPKWKMNDVLNEVEGLDHDILDMMGIQTEWFNRQSHELSGGELQRFCIARAFSPETRYILADEMTSMFDAITQAQIWHQVQKLVKEFHIGMLVVSHNIHLLKRVSDRIIAFHELSNLQKR